MAPGTRVTLSVHQHPEGRPLFSETPSHLTSSAWLQRNTFHWTSTCLPATSGAPGEALQVARPR